MVDESGLLLGICRAGFIALAGAYDGGGLLTGAGDEGCAGFMRGQLGFVFSLPPFVAMFAPGRPNVVVLDAAYPLIPMFFLFVLSSLGPGLMVILLDRARRCSECVCIRAARISEVLAFELADVL